MSLPKKEEELMEIIWKLKHSFMKDILEEYSDPKPATTTVATLLKRLQERKFVDFELFGNSRRYFALVKKDKYFSKQLNGMIENFFDNSAFQFASFFTSSTNLTKKELEDLRKLVDSEIEKKK
ncbi:MAG TPA: BlaI/MecI/CopY family transcriptional regulator [Moheibacter sp.]|nr:BlaI/MecI/CopY family transcriptional regulator [Moheibacter sp.]